MRYLCLVFGGEPLGSAAAAALEPVGAAATVRVRNGRLMVTDGPLAATAEPLGGFLLIEARDLNDAIRVASQMSSACSAGIEVRPIRQLQPPSIERPPS